MNTKLKICGIKRLEDIDMINYIVPDYIGFVFAESKRKIDLDTALQLKTKLNPKIKSVGVFVNESIDNIVKIVKSKAIDIVQLHGNETNTYILDLKKRISTPVIKAIIIKDNKIDFIYPAADYLLFDSGAGSGNTFDWNISLNNRKPIFIAGGINITNIEEAYRHFKPFAFDLSSSVEIKENKDLGKLVEISSKLKTLNEAYCNSKE